MFPKISQDLRTKDYYTLFKIHTVKDQKPNTGQLENSFNFDMKDLSRQVILRSMKYQSTGKVENNIFTNRYSCN